MLCRVASGFLSAFIKSSRFTAPRANSFRGYFDFCNTHFDTENHAVTLTINLHSHSDSSYSSVKADLDNYIQKFLEAELPVSLSNLKLDSQSTLVNIKALEERFEQEKEKLDDNYCDCDGFEVHYPHVLRFTVVNEHTQQA